MELQLKITGHHYLMLKQHLLALDGKESVAVALCGRYSDANTEMLLVHDVTLINDQDCYNREEDQLCWPTESIFKYFERIGKTNMGLLKIHSHPGGYNKFSNADDLSDAEFFDSAFGWSKNSHPHGSAVMLPNGSIFGRFFFEDLTNQPIGKISIIGETINLLNIKKVIDKEFASRTIQTFGEKTFSLLSNMTIGIVGCSGTGSPVIEQLTRLGVGKLILIDPDHVEQKNLNRIINSRIDDATSSVFKVEMLAKSIHSIGLGTIVETHPVNLYDSYPALQSLIKCDAIFGCMDSVDGRYLLNQLCTFYLLPYFDIGVKLEADGEGGINKICGSVHYLQPGKSSLITRGVYNLDDLRAAAQLRKNPEEYENLQKNSYIKNVNVNSPAVISVNMQISSHAVNEFLNRIHPYKADSCDTYSLSTIDMTENYIVNVPEAQFEVDQYLEKKVGRGHTIPFIEMSDLNL